VPQMRTVLAYCGNMAHAQHTARALLDAKALHAFVTGFVYRQPSALSSLVTRLPGSERISAQLSRRKITEVPPHCVHAYPGWEILRTGSIKFGAGSIPTDLIWDQMSHSFDSMIAKRYVPHVQAIQAFEYTALAAFKRAKELGVARILHLPSLDSKQFEDIQNREKRQWRELVGPHDAYFDAKFDRRYARRQAEIAMADVIIANSTLTARSHIDSGADPRKVFVCPLGAPPAIKDVKFAYERVRQPLNVVWAGPFSLRKGAHYLLYAWRALNASSAAVLNVYGQQGLPDRLLASNMEGIVFHGSVPQKTLFTAYETADVLVFPTLSDGFGMVVAEAMAHGLPVITTDQAGAADLVNADNGLIVPAADPKSLTDALRWCLDNRDRLQAMREPALRTARDHQWAHFRHNLIRVLDKGLTRAGYMPKFSALA
jgi:glycosyltransferase involved in cell wall biosynthesis